ncbi:acyltransferase family protein [Microbacterium sp. Root180]|uniref:acyltransferase family protein n=1 Tax=Microbacterium sp. Root180 TaxID=1736483 RepID=UPI0006F9ADD5|nr:acyltransferase family protein [Microbacterium sp. Root180]KRB38573.1 acyltransferase [Microbacterium sp. Root180]
MTSTARSLPSRYAGLDGLRAIAVALVLVYHLFPPALLPGGFVGVDVFFVISGFLITSLLLREHDTTGRIRLGAFWIRRLRRLVPALVLVVAVCSTLAWLIGGDVLVRLGSQIVGAGTFSYNWLSIAADTGYFGGATPELFRNFWSLSVEEQFYVVWPLVLPLFLLLPRGAARTAAALALAAASAVWMGSVVSGGGDLTRAYFGTDTHSFGILLGVALAFLLVPVLSRPTQAESPPALPGVTLPPGWTLALPTSALPAARASWIDRPATRTVTGCLGIAALAGVAVVAAIAPTDGAVTFPGTLLTASICTAIAIAAGVWPRSWFGPALDVQPLRWIGDRSYGIYLWHWPLLVLAMAAVPGADVPVWMGFGVLALTLIASELSYRFVETPIRRRGFRACLRGLVGQARGGPRGHLRLGAVVIVAAVVFGGTSAAIAAAPVASTGETVVEAGQAALERATASPAPSATPTALATASPEPTPVVAQPNGPLTMKPSPTPSATPVTGDQITAVGDSVMLASAPALLEQLPGIQVDAAVSRSAWAGPGILEQLAGSGALRPYVVVALGTNGPVDPGSLERMAQIAGPDRHLVLVNAFAPRDWIPGVNHDLAEFAKSHPRVVVADWSTAIGTRTDLLAGDSIHPGAAGGRVFAETIARTIDEVERERARRQYQNELRLYDRLSDRPLPVAE